MNKIATLHKVEDRERYYGVRIHQKCNLYGHLEDMSEIYYHHSRKHLLQMVRHDRKANLKRKIFVKVSFKIFKTKL